MLVGGLVSIILLALLLNAGSPPYQVMLNEFSGTFSSGTGPNQMLFSADTATNQFYFTCQQDNVYILGNFVKQAENVYYIESANAAVIPNQTVEYADYQFSLIINDNDCTFQKTSQACTIIGNSDRYQ